MCRELESVMEVNGNGLGTPSKAQKILDAGAEAAIVEASYAAARPASGLTRYLNYASCATRRLEL